MKTSVPAVDEVSETESDVHGPNVFELAGNKLGSEQVESYQLEWLQAR